jgi:hypothetical protein
MRAPRGIRRARSRIEFPTSVGSKRHKDAASFSFGRLRDNLCAQRRRKRDVSCSGADQLAARLAACWRRQLAEPCAAPVRLAVERYLDRCNDAPPWRAARLRPTGQRAPQGQAASTCEPAVTARRGAPGFPRLPPSHTITRACMSLRSIAFVLAGSLSALRRCVAHRSAYLRYVMPTFFHVLMAAAACARAACQRASDGPRARRPKAAPPPVPPGAGGAQRRQRECRASASLTLHTTTTTTRVTRLPNGACLMLSPEGKCACRFCQGFSPRGGAMQGGRGG